MKSWVIYQPLSLYTQSDKDRFPYHRLREALAKMAMNRRLFTSESVTEGHPDKICDQTSDAILDEILKKDPNARVACETTVTTGLVLVSGEITTTTYVDIPSIVRETISEIGYTRAKYGFDAETCAVLTAIDEQSPDIADGVDRALEVREGQMKDEDIAAIGAEIGRASCRERGWRRVGGVG